MAEAKTAIVNKPAWVDLTSSDAAGSRKFYAELFGWQIEVSPNPEYGGYATAKLGGKDVAGISPAQSPGDPTAWMIYIGTLDAEGLARKVEEAGGKVIAPPFAVGDQGRMAVFQDPSGAFISAWQPNAMGGFQSQADNGFGWGELNARGVDRAISFYQQVFGWGAKQNEMPEGQPPYTEFQVGGESIAGATEMNPMVPAEVPSYWLVYFNVADVDKAFDKALKAGAEEMLGPMDFPGGRFAIVRDPQGATFGLLRAQDQ
jgi:predicted enzyme related to lactoylglutathione lyase